jgi:hypothetical protein
MWLSLIPFALLSVPAASNATSGPWTAELNGTWLWHAGDNMQWASPAFDDSAWGRLALPGPPPNAPQYWIRISVQLGTLSDPGLLLGPIAYAYEVYWDGQRIGGFGDLSPRKWFVPRWKTFRIPRELTKAGLHTMAIRVGPTPVNFGARSARLSLEDSRIGNLAALRDAESALLRADFQPRLLQLLIDFGLLLAGLYFLLLPPSVSQGAAFRWLGTMLLTRALFVLFEFYANDGPLDDRFPRLLELYLLLIAVFNTAVIEFPYALFRRRVPIALRCIEPFFLLPAVWRLPHVLQMLFVLEGLVAIAAVVPVAVAVSEVRRRTAGSLVTLFLFAAWCAATLLNVAQFFLGVIFAVVVPTAVFIGPFRVWVYDAVFLLWVPAIAMQVHKTNLRFRDEQERLRGEMEAARHVQELLVPAQSVRVPGFEVDSSYRPATEVGGDFFQLFSGLKPSLDRPAGKPVRAPKIVRPTNPPLVMKTPYWLWWAMSAVKG